MSSEPLRAGDPDRLGGYWLASRLGSGGQGVVYEAYDEAANRVAVKVLHAYLPGDHQLRRRFIREVTAAQRVASFCTARVIDHDLTGERPYIVSEFVPGPSMRVAITGPLGVDDLHRLAVGMATALAAIHQAGVVHRDLKPENVLLGPDGPRVIDFGIARAVGLSMTSTGELAGTPMYMAPELFAGGRAEPAADVFAWGAMAYFAATGKDAFGAPTTVAVINRLLTASLDLTPVPEAVRDLVASALAKDPGARPTAQELLLHLLGTRHSLSDGARAAAVVRPPGELAGDPALGAVAEQMYASLPAQEREVVRQVLLRLVDVHDTNESVRRAALGELPDPVAAEPVVAALERAALIERTEDTLSVRQAALLRAWPRLNGWVSGDRDALRRHRRFGEAARHWFESGRHPEDLLRGTALREAGAWSAGAPSYLTLNPVEKAFLEASNAQSVRQRRRRRLVVTSLAGLLVVSLAAGGTAWRQSLRGDASERDLAGERARVAARNVALQADSLRRTDPVRAMLLSAAAFKIAQVPESKAAVFSSLGQQEFRVFKDPELGNSVRALTRDGRYFVSVGSRITVYDVLSGGRVSSFAGVPAGARAAAVSDDGHTLALGFDDKLTLWDLRTGKPLGEGPMSGFQTTMALRFSPGGEYVYVFSGSGGPHGALWSVVTRKLVRTGAIEYVVGPGDRGIAADGKPETPSLPKGIFGFSPDGKYALVRTAKRLELWDIEAGRKTKSTFEVNHLYSGDFARFTADGAYLVTTERNNVNSVTTMALWRVRDGAQLLRFTLPFSVLEQPGLSADSRMLTVLDDTGQVTVYDVSRVTGAHPALPAGTGDRAMTPDGGFALASIGGEARTLSIPGFTEAGPPIAPGRADPYDSLVQSVSPDARTVVTGDSSDLTKPMLVWDRPTRQVRAKVKPPQLGPNPWAPVFSPDGRFAVTAYTEDSDLYGEGSLAVYDTATWQLRKTFKHVYAQAVRFSADGRYLATGDPQGFALLDLTTMKLTQGTNPNHWLTLDATGGLGAAPSGTRSVAIWNTRTWKPTGQLFKVNGDVTNAEFSRDGSVLAVVYGDWLALFDLRTGRQLGDPWPVTVARSAIDVDHTALLAFTRDGGHLRVIGADGTFRELLLDPAMALPQVCGRAGRALTPAEWRQHVGADLPYQPVCAQP